MKTLLATTAIVGALSTPVALWAATARADDRIRPDCWESNTNGVVERHCTVHRDAPAESPSVPAPGPSYADRSPAAAVPPAYPPGYYDYAPPVAPPPPPPLGWVYAPYTSCADQQCSTVVVNVSVDGLNVRATPDGLPTMSLVNGVPLFTLQRQGSWLLVAAGCDLTPTFAWSWTAGVPLNRCWIYY